MEGIIAYVFYMTRLHALAAFPGPLLSKLTNINVIWHNVLGTYHQNLLTLHEQYGPIVRCAPNQLSFNDASAIEAIYGIKANAHVKKSSWYAAFRPAMFPAINKDVHSRLRRIMSHAFSDQALRETQPYILSTVDLWCRELGRGVKDEQGWTKPLDMHQWVGFNVFDSLGEMLFGESFHTISSEQNRWYIPTLSEAVYVRNLVGHMPLLDKIPVFGAVERRKNKTRAEIGEFAIGMLKRRLALGPDSNGRRDLIHYLQAGRDAKTGQGLTPQEIAGEAISLTGAGT